jgi:hypothetical protein
MANREDSTDQTFRLVHVHIVRRRRHDVGDAVKIRVIWNAVRRLTSVEQKDRRTLQVSQTSSAKGNIRPLPRSLENEPSKWIAFRIRSSYQVSLTTVS